MISAVIVQHNRFDLTRTAIGSFRQFHRDSEVILVDNASNEGDPGGFETEFPGLVLVRARGNLGFSRANNRGAEVAKGEYLLFLNNDTVTDSPYCRVIETTFAENPDIGVIGPGLRYPDGRFQLSAGELPGFWGEIRDKFIYHFGDRRPGVVARQVASAWSTPRETGWVTGAALGIRRDLFRNLGGFDEEMFMYFEDKDLCARVRGAGFAVRYLPGISLIHIKGGSSEKAGKITAAAYRQSQIMYYRKHRPPYESALLAAYLKVTGKYPA